MKVMVKGFGIIRKYISAHGEELVMPEDATVLNIINKLKINPQLVAMVTINGELAVKNSIPKNGDEIFFINTASGG